MIKVGSDFSGVGAFDQALIRLAIDYETVFSCDIDKYARQTYIENYGEPKYFPDNVYNREIPVESLDLYMTSPPCQSFSLSGKRKGENSDNGVLFYNSHEFILKNKPRYFIFENVKGLLSDDNGRTFQRWVDFLSKSVNGQPVIFPHDKSANYHVYYKVLNSKDYGVPQNRERIFIIGIRDNEDNNFLFPPKEHLTLKLKDVLECNPEGKYNLSNQRKNTLNNKENRRVVFTNPNTKDIANCIISGYWRTPSDGEYIKVPEKYFLSDKMLEKITYQKRGEEVANLNKGGERGGVYSENSNSISCLSATDYKQPKQVLINSRIRKLTPRECFRLQDFPDTFKMPCSDSQMYKQAGNSITVVVLEKIIKRLNIK